eukprot:2062559-Rhodomonas_salina.2
MYLTTFSCARSLSSCQKRKPEQYQCQKCTSKQYFNTVCAPKTFLKTRVGAHCALVFKGSLEASGVAAWDRLAES